MGYFVKCGSGSVGYLGGGGLGLGKEDEVGLLEMWALINDRTECRVWECSD